MRLFEQSCAQDLEGAGFVLMLRFFIAADDDHAGRDVRNAYGGISRVNALPTRSRGTHHVDTKILGFVDRDLDVVRFRHHRDGDRRGVNATGALGSRDALYTMYPALEFEAAIGAATGDQRDNFFDFAKAGSA